MAAPHRALVVEVALASPWVDQGDPIHLDGVLVQAHARRWGMDRQLDRREGLADLPPLQRLALPVSVVELAGEAVALCSAAESVGPMAPAVVHQSKRRDHEDWERLAEPVNVSAGPARDRLIWRQAQVAAGLRWFVWGHRAGIMDLLRLLWGHPERPHGAVGSVRRSGSGEILSWSVRDAEHHPERCWLDEGRAARHLPAAWVLTAARWRRGAAAPPYWHPERQVDVPWVGARVELVPAAHAALTRIACP